MWNSDIAYELFKIMEEDNVIMAYKGEVTSELLSAVFPLIEVKMTQLSEELKIKKRVFNVLVEILQNLYHHASRIDFKNPREKTALFFVGKKDGTYYIVSGNYVENNQVNVLKERIEKINSMSPEELKDYYKKVLLEGEISEKGGGGLGLIDIARKAGSKLRYAFYPVNEDYSFMLMRVIIKTEPKTNDDN